MTAPKYSFPDLLAIMERLRAPGGCPWDREQTHASLLPYLVEEAYEFIEAAERNDPAHMREELGDVLLQVVFHAQVAREAGTFDIDGVVHDIAEKLVRRHPHVFADTAGLDTADKVTAQWDEIKRAEKAGKADAPAEAAAPKAPGLLGDIPRGLPPLHKAMKISRRAVKAGFEWPDWQGVAAKVREELAEFEAEAEALARNGENTKDRAALELELGDLMFSVVNLGRHLGLDPELALARTNAKFVKRFQAMEAMARAEGKPFEGRTLEEMEALWERAKKANHNITASQQ
jgi:tetrapyrrole methylase family protein/MazG family protein